MRIDFDDLNVLTVREIMQIEEMTGGSVMELFNGSQPMGKALHAVAYIMGRRENPDLTMDEALDIEVSLADQEPPDPPEAAG